MAMSDARWSFTHVNITAELLLVFIWYFLVYFDRLHVIYDSYTPCNLKITALQPAMLSCT